MTHLPKPDAKEIGRFLSELAAEPWLGPARSFWPKCLFRTDHIEGAVGILNSGRLLSRAAASASGVLQYDSASPGIIGGTADCWKRYVRLYYRPRTPTQFANEGFRPSGQIWHGAHCPIPIVFVFDSASILTRADSEFSKGNLARNPDTGKTVDFLRATPFRDVYHDSPVSRADRDRVVFHRHAEVIVPDELDLSALRFVGCRSQAEYETLLHMLEPEARRQWSAKIGTRGILHYRRWNFIDQVAMDRRSVTFHFNLSGDARGPFHVKFHLIDVAGRSYGWSDSQNLSPSLSFSLTPVEHPESYTVTLTLDDRIAYKNRFDDVSLPL